MRIYIAGCGGMLGEAFYREFSNKHILKCSDIDVNENWLYYLDFREFYNYRNQVIDFKPDVLIHLGAFTDMEYCERNPVDTYENNTTAVENAVIIANELGIPVVYISTAGIFDDNKQNHDDWDAPNPRSVYARSKYMGERYVVENALKYYVCRAGWMMGGGKKDKKFVAKILNQVTAGKDELFIVNDKSGTPTLTYDFAKNVIELIKTGFYGVYNMACSGATSRLEITKEILKILNTDIKITEVTSDYFKNEYFAPRPENECLSNTKLKIRGINYMRDWRISLNDYLRKYYL